MNDSETISSGSSAGTEQRLRELDALHRASACLHRLRDPAVLARDVITLLKDVVHHDFAAVYLIEGDYLKTFAVSDRGLGPGMLESDFAYLESLRLKVGENVTGWVAQHGKSLRLDNVAEDERYLNSQTDIESELCVPLKSGNQIIGVVNLESTRNGAYKESDQRILEIIANQIAIAVENSQLLQRAAAAQRLQMLADLTGDVAHDIGNMLVAMSLRCDLLRLRGALAEPEKEELNAIGTVLDKTITLSRSLLQIGLPQQTTAEIMCLNSHLRNTVPLLEALGGKRVTVSVDLCDGETHIDANAGHVDQILINLLVNAREAMSDGGTLHIRTVKDAAAFGDSPGRIRLDVQDSGRGMTPETLGSAMEPHFSTRDNGSGLGLATVSRLVEELGGEISMKSEVAVGTLVQILLPLQQEPGNSMSAGGKFPENKNIDLSA